MLQPALAVRVARYVNVRVRLYRALAALDLADVYLGASLEGVAPNTKRYPSYEIGRAGTTYVASGSGAADFFSSVAPRNEFWSSAPIHDCKSGMK